jgi:hypothetical protein
MAQLSLPSYNPVPLGQAGSGEAFLLQGGMSPLLQIQKQDAITQRVREQQAKAKQQQQAQEMQELQKLRMGISEEGFLPYSKELDEGRQGVYGAMLSKYQDPTLSSHQKQVQAFQVLNEFNSKATWTKQVEGRFKDIVSLSGRDKRYNPAAVDKALYGSLNDQEGNRLPIASFNPDVLNTLLDNPDTFDKTAVAASFLEELAKADASTSSTAATPGRYGQKSTYESNYFETENGHPKLDPITGNRIARTNRPEVIEAAKRDPFVSKVISQQMQAHQQQVAGVVEKMRNLEPLTAEEQHLVAQEQTEPKRYAAFLNELLLPHAYQRTSEVQTYARPIAPKAAPRPKAALKQPANEITVTPTVGYQASAYQPEATGRLGQMKKALGIAPAPTVNYYPTVGATFASASKPYVEVTVDNRGAQVVGQGGKITTSVQGANGKVPMQVVSRDLTLYINGKRLGRKEAFQTDQEAYAYLLRTIESLTPEQARKAELRAEYRGTLTDRARTTNDGAGSGQPTPTKSSKLDPDALLERAANRTAAVVEERLSVIIPASQAADAQLQRASGGKWDARKPTEQQARVIEALKRKGGRVVTPYTSTEPQPTSQTTTGGKLVGRNDALGFGSPAGAARRGGAY